MYGKYALKCSMQCIYVSFSVMKGICYIYVRTTRKRKIQRASPFMDIFSGISLYSVHDLPQCDADQDNSILRSLVNR